MNHRLHASLTAAWQSGPIHSDWKKGLVVVVWREKEDLQDAITLYCIAQRARQGVVCSGSNAHADLQPAAEATET